MSIIIYLYILMKQVIQFPNSFIEAGRALCNLCEIHDHMVIY